jgi:hypothetical protein
MSSRTSAVSVGAGGAGRVLSLTYGPGLASPFLVGAVLVNRFSPGRGGLLRQGARARGPGRRFIVSSRPKLPDPVLPARTDRAKATPRVQPGR